MKVILPETVKNIIETLENHGHEAYAVGGCVRDCFLGKEPKDWDITTSARPEEVKACFAKTIDTGIQHGTVTVRLKGQSFEVTTYRIDGTYEDGRHPDSVVFTPSLAEDLKRRDFTINAMAYNPRIGIVDLFHGKEDLEAGIVRAVGDPERRFTEDALRMMRAVRFAAVLGFRIEEKTCGAICDLAPSLKRISMERIRDEFLKTICSEHPEEIRVLSGTGLLSFFLPEWKIMEETPQHTVHHRYNVAEHTIAVMQNVPPTPVLRLSALLHDVGKPSSRTTDPDGTDHFKGHPAVSAEMAGRILRRLRLDNETIRKVTTLVRFHDERPADTERSVRRAVARIGEENCPDLFVLKRADTLGQSDYRREEKLHLIDRFEERYHEILEKKEPLSVKDLAVGGSDLIAMGIPQGPEIGRILKDLLEEVLSDPEKNTKEYLLKRAGERKGQEG